MENKWTPLAFLAMVTVLPLAQQAAVPAIFIFGDSTADVGTNTFLPGKKFRADFLQNGIDFPNSVATGRFSNGLNSADFLATHFGYEKSPPPYLSLNSTERQEWSFRGMNFASGGSGLLDLTGQSMLTTTKFGKEKTPFDSSTSSNQKNVVTLGEQIQQFSGVRDFLLDTMGPAASNKFLSRSLFFISTGSNDVLEYYNSSRSISKEDFLDSLGYAYENHLKSLLNLRARKFGVIGVPAIGCCPSQRLLNASEGCLDLLNDLASAFHPKLTATLAKLSSENENMKYSLGNAYEMTINVIKNPLTYNLEEVKVACCGAKRLNAEEICKQASNLCLERKKYLFWDLFHPTEAASEQAASALYLGSTRFVTPFNFSQLPDV